MAEARLIEVYNETWFLYEVESIKPVFHLFSIKNSTEILGYFALTLNWKNIHLRQTAKNKK
jgi:hypothetical protein